MPMDRRVYPSNWDAIALAIKHEVGWTCESCQKPCRRPGEDLPSFSKRIGQPVLNPKQYLLTVAHLNHQPMDCRRENLKALCAPCHCRYDLSQMGTKIRLRREREGQLNVLNPIDRLGLEHRAEGTDDNPKRIQLHLGDIG